VPPRAETSFGGRTVHRGGFTADFGLGYPYILDLRLTAGLLGESGHGLDGGIEIRTFGQITDIAAHARYAIFGQDPAYVAVSAALGGGGGPNGRNTFFGDLGVGVTLSFGGLVNFSARTWLDFWTDRLCPAKDDLETVPRMACNALFIRGDGSSYDPRADRDSGVRWYLGAWIDVAAYEHMALFLSLYGAPLQGQRLLYKDYFNDFLLDDDLKLYGQIGVSARY
jgi:hypothetical protein